VVNTRGAPEYRLNPSSPRYDDGTVRQILHVDMDAFYASVEERDAPELSGKPVIVGGASRRGVVLAASYAARPSGVRSAMPMVQALRLCPRAIVVPPRMDRYAEVSASVFEVFRAFTPLVEGLSLDEAFLDVTASQSLFGDGEAIARRIKDRIRGELGITASAGVAPSKFVAKVASDLRKPDGLVVVRECDVASFLAPLPIERMWGIGPKTAPKLRELGFSTLGDIARGKLAVLEQTLGSWGVTVRALAKGDDPRTVDPERAAKSIGAEQTYEQDLVGRREIEDTLLEHSARVAQRLVKEGLSARGVVVKLKYADFVLRSRRTMLAEPVADTGSILSAARSLLAQFPRDSRPVRLTGVSVTHISDEPAPLALFPDRRADIGKKLEELILRVEDRLGVRITRAALLPGAGPISAHEDAALEHPHAALKRQRAGRVDRQSDGNGSI
jgi:DNA polymerase IV